MNINLEEIQNLTKDQIYSKISDFVKSIYNNYYNSEISLYKFNTIIHEIIEESKIEYDGSISYESYIAKSIDRFLNDLDEDCDLDTLQEYFNLINSFDTIDKMEEDNLFLLVKSGDVAAKNKIAYSYLTFVSGIAKRYTNKMLSYDDLIQEGNIGLLKAIDKYDPQRGIKFSTYAFWWIRQCIGRAIEDKSRTIRIPVHIFEKLNVFKKNIYKLTKELNRTPTKYDIAEHFNMTLDEVENYFVLMQDCFSIYDRIQTDDEDKPEIIDLIPNDEKSPEDQVIKKSFLELLVQFVNDGILMDRELDILLLRYGFYTGKEYTLQEIGDMYGFSKERARQLEYKALNKLWTHSNEYELYEYNDLRNK